MEQLMDGKILFGYDFICVMRALINTFGKQNNPRFNSAVIRTLLFDWQFNSKEIDESDKYFWNKVETNTLESVDDAIKRIINSIKGDSSLIERFLIELGAVGSLNKIITDEEKSFMKYISEFVDVKPSVFRMLTDLGYERGIGFLYIVDEYLREKAIT